MKPLLSRGFTRFQTRNFGLAPLLGPPLQRPLTALSQVRGRFVLVGDTGIEPVTSSVSGKRATAAPIAHSCGLLEVETGFEPV